MNGRGAWRSALAGFPLALLVAGGLGAPAAADDAAITHVESTAEGVQLLVTVPTDVEVDLEGVTATIDGEPAEATAARAADASVERTTVLVIDSSNSMAGPRFAAAKEAARTFLDTVPDDVQVGIVSFAGEVTRPLDPGLDRDAARQVVDGLALGPQTRLYDGILAAIDMAGTSGQRTLIVLSDGADTSKTKLQTVTGRIADSEVLVDVVTLDKSGATETVLRRLAEAGDGRLVDADPEALRETFTSEADVLARQVAVTLQVPPEVTAEDASVVVSLPTDTGTLTVEAFAPIQQEADGDTSAGVGAASGPRVMVPETWMYGGLAALGVGLAVVLLLLVPRKARELGPAERASAYTDRLSGRHAGSGRAEHDQALATAKDAAKKVLEHNRSLEARIALRLESAGNPLKPAEWLLLHATIFVGAGMVGLLLGKGSLVVGVLFLVLGGFGPLLWLKFKAGRRRKAFNSSLPDTLQLMSGSLAAGLSLAQSVDTIVREGVEPVASEYKRVLVETRLGVSLEDALEGVADRFQSKDFGWVVMAIKIQRQVGGNLAELLDTVAATMREREYMRRQVAALAAEGKLSAWVLGGLPPAFLLYLLLTNRDYVMVMFTEPLGWLMLGGAGVLLSVGVFWMSRLVKVEV